MDMEQFVSGFCKAQNQTRMVLCEYELSDEGKQVLADTDCAYGVCPHSRDCILIKNAGGGAAC